MRPALPGVLFAAAIASPLPPLLVCSPAQAQSARAPDPAASVWGAMGLRGIEIQAMGGVAYGGGSSPVQAPGVYGAAFPTLNPAGTILNPAGAQLAHQAFTPYTYDPLGFAFSAGYRLGPSFSLGALVTYANYGNNADPSTGDLADGTGGLTRVRWALGAYARYYVTALSVRLHPWVQVGLGYVEDSASYAHPLGFGVNNGGGPDNGNYILRYGGLTVPVGVGLDWRLAPVFAIGPFFTYEAAFPLRGCVQITVDQTAGGVGPVNTCDGSVVQTHVYGSFLAGLFAKVTFDLRRR